MASTRLKTSRELYTSSVTRTVPAPRRSSRLRSRVSAQTWHVKPASRSIFSVKAVSAGVGASTSTRSLGAGSAFMSDRRRVAGSGRYTARGRSTHRGSSITVCRQRCRFGSAARGWSALMAPRTFFDDRQRLSHLAEGRVIAQQQHGVVEIARIHRRARVAADDAILRHEQQRGDALLAEICQQLVHVQREKTVAGHGVEIAVKAVDYHDTGLIVLHRLAHDIGEFARREFRRVHLLYLNTTRADVVADVHTEARRTLVEGGDRFVEQKDRGVLVARRRRVGISRCKRGFAGTGRAEDRRARALCQTAAEQGIEAVEPALDVLPRVRLSMFRRDEPREELKAAVAYDEVVIALAKRLSSQLAHLQLASHGAVLGCLVFQGDHAVGQAVQVHVAFGAAAIVEQQHRRLVA